MYWVDELSLRFRVFNYGKWFSCADMHEGGFYKLSPVIDCEYLGVGKAKKKRIKDEQDISCYHLIIECHVINFRHINKIIKGSQTI